MFKIATKSIIKLNNSIESCKNANSLRFLFVLPGVEGNCEVFSDLSSLLEGNNVQVYGLEYTEDVPNNSLESSAGFYKEIIQNELIKFGIKEFYLAGYSFGGLIAIELCKQIEIDLNFKLINLFLFDSSIKFYRTVIHSLAKKMNVAIPNKDIFKREYIYTGTLSIFLSLMIGIPNLESRLKIYNHLKHNSKNLDDAIDKAFDFIDENSMYTFDSEEIKFDMKLYLKILLLKSNAGFVYEFDGPKLKTPTFLIKPAKFFYSSSLNDIYVSCDYDSEDKYKLELNKEDYNLNETCDYLNTYTCTQGSHWTYLSESSSEITQYLINKINISKSKL